VGDKRLLPSRPVLDAMISDGLWDFKYNKHMGMIADEWARKHNITREMADEYSYEMLQKGPWRPQERDYLRKKLFQ